MNLQELLKERERIDNELEKYKAEMQMRHDLIEWKNRFGAACKLPHLPDYGGQIAPIGLPDHIRVIIVNALQAAIDKLEKE